MENPAVLKRRCIAYLLRLWQVSEAQGAPWRASLESPKSGERRGFASLAALFEYLEDETGSQPDPQPGMHGETRQHEGRKSRRSTSQRTAQHPGVKDET